MIYLDNSATTKPCKEAVEAVMDAMTENWANPSSLYHFGMEGAKLMRSARAKVAAALGAEYTYDGFASIRAGFHYGGESVMQPTFASVGAGVKFMGIKLDLAYLIGSGAMKNTLALGLGYTF